MTPMLVKGTSRHLHSRRYIYLSSFALASLALSALQTQKVLIWNASSSVPEGLYLLERTDRFRTGDMVVAYLPPAVEQLASERGYLPQEVPLIKPVAAVPPQTVCRENANISVDGQVIGSAQGADADNRSLPAWHGCITLMDGQIFLMNPAASASFDGRYFGPISSDSLIGRARPVFVTDTKRTPPPRRTATATCAGKGEPECRK